LTQFFGMMVSPIEHKGEKMKKILGFVIASAVVFVLGGCAGGENNSLGSIDTHYLTDVNRNGLLNVRVECGNAGIQYTDIDGSYGFDTEGDVCAFIFNQSVTDKPVYIKNEYGNGVQGLRYRCKFDTGSGNTPYSGTTDSDGHIKHVWGHNGELVEDECTIFY